MKIDEQMATEPEQAGHSLDESVWWFKTGPPVNVILKLLRTKLFHLLMFNLLLNISRGLLCRYKTRVSESSEVPMRMNTLVYILMPIKWYGTPEIHQSAVWELTFKHILVSRLAHLLQLITWLCLMKCVAHSLQVFLAVLLQSCTFKLIFLKHRLLWPRDILFDQYTLWLLYLQLAVPAVIPLGNAKTKGRFSISILMPWYSRGITVVTPFLERKYETIPWKQIAIYLRPMSKGCAYHQALI